MCFLYLEGCSYLAIINYDYRCLLDSLLCIGGEDGKEGGCLEGVQRGRHGRHDAPDFTKGKRTIQYLNIKRTLKIKSESKKLTRFYLPKVAAEVAAPLSQAKKITMVSKGNMIEVESLKSLSLIFDF